MMKAPVLFATLCVGLLLCGCTDSAVGNDASQPFAAQAPVSDWMQVTGITTIADPAGGAALDLAPDERLDLVAEAVRAVDHAVGTTDDWKTAQAQVDRLLASPEAEQNPMIARIAPVALLRAHLLRTDDAEALPEVWRYTEALVDAQSERTDVISEGLEAIQDITPQQDLARLASLASESAAMWTETCGNCDARMYEFTEDGDRSPISRAERAVFVDRLAPIASSAR